MSSRRYPLLVVACCAAFVLVGGLRGEAPDWLLRAAAVTGANQPPGTPAVVLLNETTLELDDRGNATELHRYAVKILHSAGRKHAVGAVAYNGASSKVLEATAWVLRAGEVLEWKKKANWVDVTANAPGAAIDETRVSSLDFSERVAVGDIMGYETRVRMPLVVAQLHWGFGDKLPQQRESLSLVLPAGFTVRHQSYGRLTPSLEEGPNRWTWSLTDQPYLPDEAAAPEHARLSAELLLQIQAPASARNFTPRTFTAWSEVTDLTNHLNAGQCDSSPALVAKVHELIAGERTPLGIIQRIAEQVQKIRYIGIYRGLRYGYGWKARKASEVFATGYGDCKDKANLMMAMLLEAGIKSHRVIAQLDRDRPVRPEFPSPIQFNHAIIAIEVPESVQLPAVLTVPSAGRLLFFDPTNPFTAVGDLTLALQGGWVHLISPGVNELIRLPEFPPEEDFRLERRVEMTLAADGTLNVQGKVTGYGQAGAQLRQKAEQATTPPDLEKWAVQQLAASLKTSVLTDAKAVDDRPSGQCGLSFACVQKGYLQHNSAGAVLKLDVLSKQHVLNLSGQPRQLPVDLLPLNVDDRLVLALPAGYLVDEIPRAAGVKSEYGRFDVAFEQKDNHLVLQRRLVFERRIVPVEEIPRLRQFLSDIARADRTAVLIKRKP